MKASTEQLVSALRVLSVEIHSEDGVANAVIAEAADRMTLLANLVAQHVQETKDDVEQMAVASETMVEATAKIQELRARIKHLEEWKESALEVEREWNANAIATMLGGKPGESQRGVIQREVPKLLARVGELQEANRSNRVVMSALQNAVDELTRKRDDDFQRLKSQVKRLIEAGDHLEKDLKEHWEETRSMQKWTKAKEAKP